MKGRNGLLLVGLVVTACTAYMAFLGATSSWQYYLTADECLRQASGLVGSRVRVSGAVAPGSLQVRPDRRGAVFELATSSEPLRVEYTGTVPDNLAEGKEVVVEGRLVERRLVRAHRVLTKCASKYRSKPLAAGEVPADADPSKAHALADQPARKLQ